MNMKIFYMSVSVSILLLSIILPLISEVAVTENDARHSTPVSVVPKTGERIEVDEWLDANHSPMQNDTGSEGIEDTHPPWGDWNHYHNYMEITGTLLFLNDTYPNIVDVFSTGKSWQNRDIYCIRLTNEDITHPRPKVFFVGYHHAREFISAELPLYFAVETAANYGTNETVTRMLDYCEIYIVVALNVDGFDAVQANEWQRKNVHPFDEDEDGLLDEDPPDDEDGDGYIEDLWQADGTDYVFIRWEGVDDDGDGLLNEDWVGGVDLNRNYGYQWNTTCDTGSPNPSAEDYRGPAPFSEPETQAIRDLALDHDFKYAISFHSGAEIILYPWGHTNTSTPHDSLFREITANLSSLVNAPYNQSSVALYTSSGDWDDWMYGNRSTFALTCEIYTNNSTWQYEPGPDPDTWWEKGVFNFFNPDPTNIETVIQRWLPVFTYLTNRAISEAYDIAVVSVVPSANEVYEGQIVNITVAVKNNGSVIQAFNVTAYANTSIIQTQTVSHLAPASQITLTFLWNTTGVSLGNYTIRAEASVVPGETYATDNVKVNGTVNVIPEFASMILPFLVFLTTTIAATFIKRKMTSKPPCSKYQAKPRSTA